MDEQEFMQSGTVSHNVVSGDTKKDNRRCRVSVTNPFVQSWQKGQRVIGSEINGGGVAERLAGDETKSCNMKTGKATGSTK